MELVRGDTPRQFLLGRYSASFAMLESMHLDPCAQSDGRHSATPGTRAQTRLHHHPPRVGVARTGHFRPSLLAARTAPKRHPSSPAREGGEGDTGRTITEGNKRGGALRRRRGGPPGLRHSAYVTWPGAPPEGAPCVAARIRACDAVCARRGTRTGRVSSHASARATRPRPHARAWQQRQWHGSCSHASPHPSPGWPAARLRARARAGILLPVAHCRCAGVENRAAAACLRQRHPRSSLPRSHYHTLEGSK